MKQGCIVKILYAKKCYYGVVLEVIEQKIPFFNTTHTVVRLQKICTKDGRVYKKSLIQEFHINYLKEVEKLPMLRDMLTGEKITQPTSFVSLINMNKQRVVDY